MFNELIIFAAKYLFVAVPILALVYWIRAPYATRRYLLLLGLLAGAAALGIGRLIAYFYFDPRPFVTGHFIPLIAHEPDNGFPSDHTLLSSAIAASVTVCSRSVGLGLWAITAVVGIARILCGLHSPIDVIGSICIASASAYVAHSLLRRRFAR